MPPALPRAVSMSADCDHRRHGDKIWNSGEQANLKRVGDARLFDNGWNPEAYNIDAACNAEIRRAQEPYSAANEACRSSDSPSLSSCSPAMIAATIRFSLGLSHLASSPLLSR